MNLSIIAAFLALTSTAPSGCGSVFAPKDKPETYIPWQTHRITGPDGSKGWSVVTCDYYKGNCYDGASHACPNGYEVTDNTNHSSTDSHSNSEGIGIGGNSWIHNRENADTTTSTHFQAEWLVHCKEIGRASCRERV